jgi:hypothetical protein
MTPQQVRDETNWETKWGRPQSINRTTTSTGVNEQWVYGGYDYENNYLYFTNGVLTTIQSHYGVLTTTESHYDVLTTIAQGRSHSPCDERMCND